VRTLEAIVAERSSAVPAPPPYWPPPPAVSARHGPSRPAPAAEDGDLEDLLGGRVLGWVGGIAVVLAAAFFLVMAVHRGWIGETTRVILAFLASTALVVAGAWLHERKGWTQASLAMSPPAWPHSTRATRRRRPDTS
jgi:uncharacterized membrane protein